MKTIPLTKGRVAIVDDCDYEWLSQWKWHLQTSQRTNTVYASRRANSKTILMHRLILGTPEDMQTDHKNKDGLDNRRTNLRFATMQQNAHNRNRYSHNSSGYKGVIYEKETKNWRARIRIQGKLKNIGRFTTAKAAALAYDKTARQLHKQYARLNFPMTGEEHART